MSSYENLNQYLYYYFAESDIIEMDGNERKECDSNHSHVLWFVTLEAIEDQDVVCTTTKIMNVAHQ
jgi:hypothetical protein